MHLQPQPEHVPPADVLEELQKAMACEIRIHTSNDRGGARTIWDVAEGPRQLLLRELRDSLQRLRALPSGWDGPNSERPAEWVLGELKMAMEALMRASLPPWPLSIGATSDGEIWLAMNNGKGRELEIYLGETEGSAEWIMRDGASTKDGTVEIGSVDELLPRLQSRAG